jgi:hypothetical protein
MFLFINSYLLFYQNTNCKNVYSENKLSTLVLFILEKISII